MNLLQKVGDLTLKEGKISQMWEHVVYSCETEKGQKRVNQVINKNTKLFMDFSEITGEFSHGAHMADCLL